MRKHRLMSTLLLAGYLLGIWRGYVAVWKEDDPEPWLVTKMSAALLPLEDVKRLEKGVQLPDDYTLAQALEDYCS